MTKEIKELNKWKHTPCWWIWRLNIIKMSVIYRFSAVSFKNLSLVETEKSILKCLQNLRGSLIAKTVLEKEKQIWRPNTCWYQNSPWSYSNQNSVLLAFRHIPIVRWFSTSVVPRLFSGEGTVFWINGVG